MTGVSVTYALERTEWRREVTPAAASPVAAPPAGPATGSSVRRANRPYADHVFATPVVRELCRFSGHAPAPAPAPAPARKPPLPAAE